MSKNYNYAKAGYTVLARKYAHLRENAYPPFSPKFHLKAFLLRLYVHLKIKHAQSFYARASVKETKTS